MQFFQVITEEVKFRLKTSFCLLRQLCFRGQMDFTRTLRIHYTDIKRFTCYNILYGVDERGCSRSCIYNFLFQAEIIVHANI